MTKVKVLQAAITIAKLLQADITIKMSLIRIHREWIVEYHMEKLTWVHGKWANKINAIWIDSQYYWTQSMYYQGFTLVL